MIGDIPNRLWIWIRWVGNAIADAVSALVVAARVAAEAVVDLLGAAQAVDWVLLALAALLLWYVWRRIRLAGVLGPVKVVDLATEDKDKQRRLSSLLREDLTSKGLVPAGPAVPAGSPDAGIVDAVSASPIAHASWVAKLLQAGKAFMPTAREYEVSGILTLRPATEVEDANTRNGLTYTLSGTGRPALYTVETAWARTHREAVPLAAAAIYMHVSRSDDGVFPRWAKWWRADAFNDYLRGLESEGQIGVADGDDVDAHINAARLAYAESRAKQPANRLPAIRAANLDETAAAVAESAPEKQRNQLSALSAYLEIAKDADTLAEARYRASVLLAGLDPSTAPYCDDLSEGLRDRLGLASNADADQIWKAAKRRARRESWMTRNLLRWWGVPLKSGRLRTRFEPRGRERRQFLRAVKVSKRCIHKSIGRSLPWNSLAVWLVFIGRWESAGWQAHYNAACYFAMPGSSRDPSKAFDHLERAIGDPRSGVTHLWLKHDGDLESLEDSNASRWNAALDSAQASEPA